ncbi:MAG TPA: hypothetical protein VH478_11625 [Trebonia sp.]|jgi:hypothetical protein|nr:hypothetical protein [Trebonia sp.]
MPFIQVTWLGTEPPIRQTVRVAGADPPDVPLAEPDELDELELELQAVIASVAAATPAATVSAADLFLSPTLLALPFCVRGGVGQTCQ